jgi:hypothetical protein
MESELQFLSSSNGSLYGDVRNGGKRANARSSRHRTADARMRFTVRPSSLRKSTRWRDCANSGRSLAARRTDYVDPLLPFKIDPMNGGKREKAVFG